MVEQSRPAWQGSTRRERLPGNWQELRSEGKRLNPARVCHWCGGSGGTTLDHKIPGDAVCQKPREHPQPCQCNLDWIHDRQDVKAGRATVNCHGRKTGAEGAAARQRIDRKPERHPAFG